MPGYSAEGLNISGVETILNILYLGNGFCWCCSSLQFRPTIQRHFDSWFSFKFLNCFAITLIACCLLACLLACLFACLFVCLFACLLCFASLLLMMMIKQQSEWTNVWWWCCETNFSGLSSEQLNVQEVIDFGDNLQSLASHFLNFFWKLDFLWSLDPTRPPYTSAADMKGFIRVLGYREHPCISAVGY